MTDCLKSDPIHKNVIWEILSECHQWQVSKKSMLVLVYCAFHAQFLSHEFLSLKKFLCVSSVKKLLTVNWLILSLIYFREFALAYIILSRCCIYIYNMSNIFMCYTFLCLIGLFVNVSVYFRYFHNFKCGRERGPPSLVRAIGQLLD